KVRNLARMRSGATSIRFRAQNLKARLVTCEHYWTRILGQIEKGTYKRVLAASKRRELAAQQKRLHEREAEPAAPPELVAEPDAPRQRSPRTPSGRVLPDGIDAGEARALFKQFVAAKKAAGEPIGNLTYGRLIDKLA